MSRAESARQSNIEWVLVCVCQLKGLSSHLSLKRRSRHLLLHTSCLWYPVPPDNFTERNLEEENCIAAQLAAPSKTPQKHKIHTKLMSKKSILPTKCILSLLNKSLQFKEISTKMVYTRKITQIIKYQTSLIFHRETFVKALWINFLKEIWGEKN